MQLVLLFLAVFLLFQLCKENLQDQDEDDDGVDVQVRVRHVAGQQPPQQVHAVRAEVAREAHLQGVPPVVSCVCCECAEEFIFAKKYEILSIITTNIFYLETKFEII